MPGNAPPLTDERALLLAYLEQQRDGIRNAAYGLTDEQARSQPTAGTLSIGGLIKHVANMETTWVDMILQRRARRVRKTRAKPITRTTSGWAAMKRWRKRSRRSDAAARGDQQRRVDDRRPRSTSTGTERRAVVSRRRRRVVGAMGAAPSHRRDRASRRPRRHRARVDRRRNDVSPHGRGRRVARDRLAAAVDAGLSGPRWTRVQPELADVDGELPHVRCGVVRARATSVEPDAGDHARAVIGARDQPTSDTLLVGAEHRDDDAVVRRLSTSAMRVSPAHAYSVGVTDHRDLPEHRRDDAIVPALRLECDVIARSAPETTLGAPVCASRTSTTSSCPGRSSPSSLKATRPSCAAGRPRRCTSARNPTGRPCVACACCRRAARPTTPEPRTTRDQRPRSARRDAPSTPSARHVRRISSTSASPIRSPMPTGPADSADNSASTSRVADSRVRVEHVLVRPQSERARHHVRVQEPRPQQLGTDEISVIAAGADRGDVAQPAHLREVGRRCHAPLRVQIPLAERLVDDPPATPPRGPARAARRRRGSTRSTNRVRTLPRPT